MSKKPESKPPRQELLSSRSGDVSPVAQPQGPGAYPNQDSLAYQQVPPSHQSNTDVAEPQQQLYQEDLSMLVPPAQAPAPVAPTVSSVTITRRDPRMARHGSGVTVTYTAPEKPSNSLAEPLPLPVIAPVEAVPVVPSTKLPLPMPPASPSSVAVSKSTKTRCLILMSVFY